MLEIGFCSKCTVFHFSLISFLLQEISALLSGGVLTEEDESAVEEELDALIAAAVQKQLPDAPTAAENPEVVLPDVPEAAPGIVSFCDIIYNMDLGPDFQR